MNERFELGEVADVIRGVAFGQADVSREPADGVVPILRAGNIADQLKLEDDLIFVPNELVNKQQLLRKGDIVMCTSSGSASVVGKSAILARAWHGSFGAFCAAIRARAGRIDPNYLAHFLRSPKFRAWTQRAEGANIKNIRTSEIQTFEIHCPSLKEQERIAAILDKADAIRRKRQQALAEIDALLRATFLDMFGDPAANPKGFDVEPVQRVLSRDRAGTQSGPFGAALKKNELVAQGIPVWGIENVEHNSFNPTMRLFITPEKFAELERYDVRDGDVLISRAGTVGRMCIARPPVARSVLSTNLVRVSLDHSKMLPEYFVTLFTSFPDRLSRLRANKKDNAFSFLNPGTLKVLDIPQPDIKLQIEFARRVKALARTKSLRAQAMEQANELFCALSQRAFRGEL